jgi:hypothetical protein
MCYRWKLVAIEGKFFEESSSGRPYSGIFWIMGRFDRGWPERPIFGNDHSMPPASTRAGSRRTWWAVQGRPRIWRVGNSIGVGES